MSEYTAEQMAAEQNMRDRLADLFEAMGEASELGVDPQGVLGEIGARMIAAAQASGQDVPLVAKMLFG